MKVPLKSSSSATAPGFTTMETVSNEGLNFSMDLQICTTNTLKIKTLIQHGRGTIAMAGKAKL